MTQHNTITRYVNVYLSYVKNKPIVVLGDVWEFAEQACTIGKARTGLTYVKTMPIEVELCPEQAVS